MNPRILSVLYLNRYKDTSVDVVQLRDVLRACVNAGWDVQVVRSDAAWRELRHLHRGHFHRYIREVATGTVGTGALRFPVLVVCETQVGHATGQILEMRAEMERSAGTAASSMIHVDLATRTVFRVATVAPTVGDARVKHDYTITTRPLR